MRFSIPVDLVPPPVIMTVAVYRKESMWTIGKERSMLVCNKNITSLYITTIASKCLIAYLVFLLDKDVKETHWITTCFILEMH